MMYHSVKRIFQPLNITPKDAIVKFQDVTSLSQKLLVDNGIIRGRGGGMYTLLPLGHRVIRKLTNLIENELHPLSAQQLTLPALTSAHLWKKTGRWESTGPELIKVKDRHEKEFVLSPTHEEAITDLISEVYPLSRRQLPLRLYQFSNKFRDEMKPRYGLLRAKEFLMKDMYTFDMCEDTAKDTYIDVCSAYDNIFNKIGVPFIKVAGSCGNIGGSLSHEYHFPADIGEDTLLICGGCRHTTNIELLGEESANECPHCQHKMEKSMGIEVGHTFLLGTKYSGPLNASYQDSSGKPAVLHMGCYGLGVSRIMAAAVEVLSSQEAIRWPMAIAPFTCCIITPKKGSKEENVKRWVSPLLENFSDIPLLKDNVIVDDRDWMTLGKRVMEARRVGYPLVIVLGKKAANDVPTFELINSYTRETNMFSQIQLLQYLREFGS